MFLKHLNHVNSTQFLARDAFVRRIRCAIVMMFVRLSVWGGRA